MLLPILVAVILGVLLYKFFFPERKKEENNSFWKEFGIRQIDTSISLGEKTQSDTDNYAYNQLGSSEKYCGIWEHGQPMLLVKDLEFAKKILIRDFDHFVNRRLFFTKEDGILGNMLSSLQDEEWKGVRSSISPAFTTAKIRRMMEFFNSVGHEWILELKQKTRNGVVVIDVLKSVNQYTTEVISASVFGMKTDSVKNPNSTFNVMANRVADFGSFKAVFKFALRRHFPKLFKWLGFSPFDLSAISFFEKILEQNLKSRMSEDMGKGKRNDFLQLLIEAKNQSLKTENGNEKEKIEAFEKDAEIILKEGARKKQWITDEMVHAQTLHKDVQKRLREEVNKIVKKDGTLDYDDVGQLNYLDMVMNETLRKFPDGARHERVCAREYKDPETGTRIPKDSVVIIPVNAFHHDKKYFENPDKFDPEHFSAEKKALRNPYAFMPWGFGPRNCIGMRFAQIKVKSFVALIVHNFLIEPTSKTPVPLQGQKVTFQLLPPKDLELKLIPISN